MPRVRWFVGGAVIALILVLAVSVWIDRAAPVRVDVNSLPTREIRVQVEGGIATPGVVTLSGGARLVDAINAAGGFSEQADVTTLNLAGRVGDGEQIVIPILGSPIAQASEPTSSGAPIDLNRATVAELVELPGIGEVLAGRIVEYRDEHGNFTSVDELANVQGISSRLVEDLRPMVTVDDGG